MSIRQTSGILLVFTKPDVYKSPGSDTYIIFGNFRLEDQRAGGLESLKPQQSVNIPRRYVEGNVDVVDEDDDKEVGLKF